MIDGLVTLLSDEMNTSDKKVNVIATGGMSELIVPYCEKVQDIDKLLTLKGLNLIYNRLYD